MMCGGHSQPRAAEQNEIDMIMSLKEAIEEKTGQNYQQFEVSYLTSQVVSGTNFWVKIKTD